MVLSQDLKKKKFFFPFFFKSTQVQAHSLSHPSLYDVHDKIIAQQCTIQGESRWEISRCISRIYNLKLLFNQRALDPIQEIIANHSIDVLYLCEFFFTFDFAGENYFFMIYMFNYSKITLDVCCSNNFTLLQYAVIYFYFEVDTILIRFVSRDHPSVNA